MYRNLKKLGINSQIYIENRTFLYISKIKLKSNGHTKF